MKLNSISKREAVQRLKAWQARLLDTEQTAAASAVYQARHRLEEAEGETLLETYSRARNRTNDCQKVHEAVMKERRDTGPALLVGAGSLALGISSYLSTASLNFAAICTLTSASLVPIWGACRGVFEVLAGKDYTGVLAAGCTAGLATMAVAGVSPSGWQLSLAAAAITTGGLFATAFGAQKMADHYGQIKMAVEENLEVFNRPPQAGPSLSARCSRQMVLETLDKLTDRALEASQSDQARQLQQERRVLDGLEGSNFLEMFEDSQARQPGARVVLQKHARVVLQVVRDRDQIETMARGSAVMGQLVVRDEWVDVGGQGVPVRD
ncbi:MAG: hypothetical protein AB7S38_40525 [Vulcanimicrobiota bacterium]